MKSSAAEKKLPQSGRMFKSCLHIRLGTALAALVLCLCSASALTAETRQTIVVDLPNGKQSLVFDFNTKKMRFSDLPEAEEYPFSQFEEKDGSFTVVIENEYERDFYRTRLHVRQKITLTGKGSGGTLILETVSPGNVYRTETPVTIH